jgi:putative transposase
MFVLHKLTSNKLTYKLEYERHLPHIQPPGATFFVTYRLAGSIPAAKIRELVAETDRLKQKLEQIEDTAVRHEQQYLAQKRLFSLWDTTLDSTQRGPFWLKQEAIAQLVWDSLHYLDNDRYDLDTFTIMPNHTHVLFTPLAQSDGNYYALSSILHRLKSFTATKANALLCRKGQFWQHESYDHIVRNEAELDRIRRYILYNPVKADLVDDYRAWKWTYCKHW